MSGGIKVSGRGYSPHCSALKAVDQNKCRRNSQALFGSWAHVSVWATNSLKQRSTESTQERSWEAILWCRTGHPQHPKGYPRYFTSMCSDTSRVASISIWFQMVNFTSISMLHVVEHSRSIHLNSAYEAESRYYQHFRGFRGGKCRQKYTLRTVITRKVLDRFKSIILHEPS